ncbi:MAG: PucR family transcriptional regulator [Lachnotalea sp.]
MSVSIEDIYKKTKMKYQLKIIAGESGLSSIISWIYIMEDVTTADFIRGSELIITTGLGINTEEAFYHLVEVAMNQKASGIIVNTGNYINTIPISVIELCNKVGFPLLVMPWEIHLVDITQEYCNWIIKDRQKQQDQSECFYNILFSPEKADFSLVKRFDYEINGQYSVIILSIPQSLSGREGEEIYKYFEMDILSNVEPNTVKFCMVIYEKMLIVIVESSNGNLNEFIENIEIAYRSSTVLENGTIGIGCVQRSIFNLHKSYQHATAAYKLASLQQTKTIVYEKMGVYKILLEIQDREVLENIFKEYLGKIEEHDSAHNSQYMDTLRLYLLCNASIQLIAQKSFTHRNTINYRIKKIKELLGKDLEDAEYKFMLQLCFYINDTLNDSENKK